MIDAPPDIEHPDPLKECGRRWTLLRKACHEYAQSLAGSREKMLKLREAELSRHQIELNRIEQERQQRADECEKIREEGLRVAGAEADQELKNIEDGARVRAEEIKNNLRENQHSSKQHMEEAIWLAESVLETGEAAPRVEFEETRSRIVHLQTTLKESLAAALVQLRRFRQTRPPPHPVDLNFSPKACEGILTTQAGIAMDAVERFRKLKIPGLLRGPILLVPSILLTGTLTGVAAMAGVRGLPLLGALGAGVVLSLVGISALWFMARTQVRRAWIPISIAEQMGAAAGEAALKLAADQRRAATAAAVATRDREVKAAKEKWKPIIEDLQEKSRTALHQARRQRDEQLATVGARKAKRLQEIEAVAQAARASYEKVEKSAASAEKKKTAENRAELDAIEQTHAAQRSAAWLKQRDAFKDWTAVMEEKGKSLMADWQASAREDNLPGHISEGLAFGRLKLDLASVADGMPAEPDCAWSPSADAPPSWEIPAFRPLPEAPSLLVETPLSGRDKGLEMIQSAALRLLTQAPPGKVRFYFFDPVGLGQSFAGFMHLADEMESLVGERIWSEPRHIEQKLTDLTEHVETVIQKYLRDEFDTIADYNLQAGELAEPLRVIVFADFPAGLSDAGSKRFASLLQSGARCGIHFLLLRDPAQPLPAQIKEEELLQRCQRIQWKQDRFVVDAPGLEDVPFIPATMPAAALLQTVLKSVGRAAKAGSRVEVPFQAIEPGKEQRWSSSSAKMLRVPVGRSGANKLQYVEIGEGTRQHVLLAGKTGSGKSTLLHALITNVALWYSPDEVELWLIDFKKGVEFKAYATNGLPHARAVAVESDREFGLSVLQGLDAELKRRGDLFRMAGVQDLAAWRLLGKPDPMPRTLLIVDEFQELFVEEDKVAQDASLLLDRLVRQGRAFGMHVILGSQTLGGTYALPRTTMGQMGIRIALQCNEADSAMILSDDNTAARLLSRPGEAIYNDAGGLIEGNSPFQVVWLTDVQRDERVRDLATAARTRGVADRKMIVFDGTASARIEQCQPLKELIAKPPASGVPALQFFVGNPVAIRNASSVTFRRQSGANLIVVGQREDVATGLSVAALASFAAATRTLPGRVVLLDGTTPDSLTTGALQAAVETLKLKAELPGYRDTDAAIIQLGVEVARRVAEGRQDQPPILLMIHGLQRFRTLRRDEDDFSVSTDGPPKPDKVFGGILRDGPSVGVHVVAWADTAPSLQRCIDRNALREFDSRILMQMSAVDSSYLMDMPTASRLGADRALIFSEEKGATERFRPFEIPSTEVLAALFH
ncbi:MAG: cell division protein FtsK [Planctomycetes bacterium]|nr:cell division protein FtsK [Planctomycetota bacterium]